MERIRPVMTVNKLDRCFLELMLDGEEAYSGFRRTIESANVIMATYADELLGDTQVYPEKGTVSFSAGLHGWAFTLTVFADLYAKKFGVEVSMPPAPCNMLRILRACPSCSSAFDAAELGCALFHLACMMLS